jgi:hypothetical protein
MISIILFFSLNTFAHEGIICNGFVKVHVSMLETGMGLIYKINDFFSNEDPCIDNRPKSAQLIDALIDSDEVKVDELLKDLSDSYLVRAFNKFASKQEDPEEDEEEEEKSEKQQGQKFQKFIKENMDKFSNLGDEEKKVFKKHRLKSLMVLYMYDYAKKYYYKQSDDLVNKDPVFSMKNSHGDAFQGTSDAYRHILINAMASRFGFSNVVEEMGTAHETSIESRYDQMNKTDSFDQKAYFQLIPKPPYEAYKKCNVGKEKELNRHLHLRMANQAIDHKMDLHNNAIGIEIGKNHPCASISEISKLIIDKIKTGKAMIVDAGKNNELRLVASNNFSRRSPDSVSTSHDIKIPYSNSGQEYSCPEFVPIKPKSGSFGGPFPGALINSPMRNPIVIPSKEDMPFSPFIFQVPTQRKDLPFGPQHLDQNFEDDDFEENEMETEPKEKEKEKEKEKDQYF